MDMLKGLKVMNMKHIFIVNPAAGVGAAKKVNMSELMQKLKDAGVDYEIHRTLSKEEVASWIKERASSGEELRFYAVGGDGTICDVVNAIIAFPNAQLAIMPCGSGNDFVKNFTNIKNFLDIDAQLNGSVEVIDAIKYNDEYCLNMLNIGADCDIVVRSGELRQKGVSSGAASYALAAMQILTKWPKYRFSYTVDGTEHEEDLMLVAAGNGMFCGGGFKSCPKARLQDGLIDVGFVRPCKGMKFFSLLPKYHNGTHLDCKLADEFLVYKQLKEFDLKPLDDCVVSVDGEVSKFKPAHISIVPSAIKVVVPRGSEIIK